MSSHWIKVVVPPPVPSPRGARWAADAALWLAQAWQRARGYAFKPSSPRAAT